MPEGYASKPPVKAGTTDGAAPSFTITSASLSDVDSLSTIVARSFHPVNPYFAKVCPDTPAVREWWSKSFLTEINGPGICHPLVAIENSSNAVVGILALRLMEASDKGSGIWSTHPITPDHYADAYRSMIGVMTEQRESLMRGRGISCFSSSASTTDFKGGTSGSSC
ncbi:hypothetical protein H2203_005405 [Taxawa tesnikishii (nom. ined.)]|nr:hypothetical protein H2203_005405 [Dothideales sp. JES 119]